MLYQASRDGFGASVFHAKCDGVLGTLVVVKDTNSSIFGGFTKVDWSNSGSQFDSAAFLFSLVNSLNISFKFNLIRPENAVYSDSFYGPSFGDMYIVDRSNQSSSNSFYFGYIYAFPNFTNLTSFSANFQTLEIEVYSLNRKYI